jgi:hypothetical protein
LANGRIAEHIAANKKSPQVYLDKDGERFLYALTSDLDEAKKLVQEAQREFVIGRPGKRNDTDAPAE